MQGYFQCVIPCGGDSSRLGTGQNKCLMQVGNKSVLSHLVSFWQSNNVHNFIFIVGGSSAMQVAKHACELCDEPLVIDRKETANLMKAIQLSEQYIQDKFIVALGDCLNFGEFTSNIEPLGVGACVVSEYELRKSYLVQIDSHSVTRLIEKPKSNMFGLCGMGTLFLDKRIFYYIDRLSLHDKATSVDLTGALQLAIGEGEAVKPVFFKGNYINVTYPEDIVEVERLARIYNNINITSKVICC